MSRVIKLKVKQSFTDRETKEDYKKGKTYSFTEKRADELLKNPYIVEKVAEKEAENKTEQTEDKTEIIK